MDNEKIARKLVDMAQSLTAANKGYWHYASEMGGMLEIEGISDASAAKFGVKSDEWELTKIGNKLWGAYDGEKLMLFTNKGDFVPDEWMNDPELGG